MHVSRYNACGDTPPHVLDWPFFLSSFPNVLGANAPRTLRRWGPNILLRGGGGLGGAKKWGGRPWTCGGDVSGGLGGGFGGGYGGGVPKPLADASGIYISGLDKCADFSAEAAAQKSALAAVLAAKGFGPTACSLLPSASKGFAFLKFATPVATRRAMQILGAGLQLNGKPLRVQESKS